MITGEFDMHAVSLVDLCWVAMSILDNGRGVYVERHGGSYFLLHRDPLCAQVGHRAGGVPSKHLGTYRSQVIFQSIDRTIVRATFQVLGTVIIGSKSMWISNMDARPIKLDTSASFPGYHHQAVTARSNVPGDHGSEIQHFPFRAVEGHLAGSNLDPKVIPGQVNVHVHQRDMATAILQSDHHHKMVTGHQDIRVPQDSCTDAAILVRAVDVQVTRSFCYPLGINRCCEKSQ